jgi:hypothetical protein
MANLTLRLVKGSALTIAEMDGNFEYFTGSYTNTGTITAQGFVGNLSGSVTGSILGNVTGNADTSTTASYVDAANVDGTVANAVTASLAAALPTSAPGSPSTGSIYFDSTIPAFYIYDGSIWLTGSLV